MFELLLVIMQNLWYNSCITNKGGIVALAKINKQTAINLRIAGFTYAQIAEYIGCSYDWCATRLSAIKPEQKQTATAMSAYLKYLEENEQKQISTYSEDTQ